MASQAQGGLLSQVLAPNQDPLKSDIEQVLNLLRAAYGRHGTLLREEDSFSHLLGNMIWGSNEIERMGCRFGDDGVPIAPSTVDREMTLEVCNVLFTNAPLNNVDFVEAVALPGLLNTTNEIIREHLARNNLQHDDTMVEWCQYRIVNHAIAAMYLLDHVVFKDNDFDATILRDTHHILTGGVVNLDQTCPMPGDDGSKLARDLAENLIDLPTVVQDMNEADRWDPYSLAAYHGQAAYGCLALRGGDTRLSRLIMNALLFKYGGTVVAVGTTLWDREAYQEVSSRTKEMVFQYVNDILTYGHEMDALLPRQLLLEIHDLKLDRFINGLDLPED
jgi:hypothetical protein